jgi:hypothetical protein
VLWELNEVCFQPRVEAWLCTNCVYRSGLTAKRRTGPREQQSEQQNHNNAGWKQKRRGALWLAKWRVRRETFKARK